MIDYRPIASKVREIILVSTSLDASKIAFEGRAENFQQDYPETDIYAEEIVGFNSERRGDSVRAGMSLTISYKLMSMTGKRPNIIEEVEQIRQEIVTAFYDRKPFEVGMPDGSVACIFIGDVQRRTAVNHKGWRLSPVDITIRAITK